MNDTRNKTASEELTGPETPEDVAILYSWANLPGAKYRDFSASRREFRAQQRARQAEDERQAELASAQILQETARRDMEEAQRALEASRQAEQEAAADAEVKARAEEAFRVAEANAHREHMEVSRRQQSAETLRLRAQAARKEMMAARKRAEEQAARYADFDAQYRAQVEDREAELPGQLQDPYYYTGQVDPAYFASTPGVRTAQATRTSTERKAYVFPVHPGSDEYDAGTLKSYRPGTTFAPSPAQDYRSLSPTRNLPPTSDQVLEREQPSEQERLTRRNPEDASNTIADNDYYSNQGQGLPPGSSSTAPFGFGTAEHDLHIRPRSFRSRYEKADEYAPSSRNPLPASPSPAQWRSIDHRSRREANADVRARTTRQPRPEEAMEPAEPESAWPEPATAVPPAWLAYNGHSTEQQGTSFVPVTRAPPLAEEKFPSTFSPAQPLQRFVEANTHGELPVRNAEAEMDPYLDAGFDPSSSRASAAPDTLQQSRERVASRWFALQGLMEQNSEHPPASARQTTLPAPVLAILSLSGGVGKTSMVATLGRALSLLGEKVFLVDTNTHGLLPYYFGARDLRPGAMRTFTPPAGRSDAPVLMAHYDLDRIGQDDSAQDQLVATVTEHAASTQRALVDLGSNGVWLARRLAYASPFVLVPLTPDMNSILSTQAMESLFAEVKDIDGAPVRPYYVLNQYDPALPLHLDVREVLQQSLGNRLLPVRIHRTPAISEALAEGMTVIDYAPNSPVAEDYKGLAHWIQSLAAPVTPGARATRWSER